MRVRMCTVLVIVLMGWSSTVWSQVTPTATLQIRAFNLPTETAQSPTALVNEPIRVRVFHPHYLGGQVQRIGADRIQEELNANGARVPIVDEVKTTNRNGEVTVNIPLRDGQVTALLIVELQREDFSDQTTQRIDGLIVAAGKTSHVSVSVPRTLSRSTCICSCRYLGRHRARRLVCRRQ